MIAIALIDYGAGNLTSVRKGLRAAGADVFTPASPMDLVNADAIVVPGVGHFQATAALAGGWRDAIADRIDAGTPLLGICLGMQWLYDGSEEAPDVPGLGLLEGRCRHLRALANPGTLEPWNPGTRTPEPRNSGTFEQNPGTRNLGAFKVPHVGWNSLQTIAPSRLLHGVADESYVYFTHSYAAPVTSACVARTDHGGPFAAVVARNSVFGVQFHPEKSGEAGLQLLRNFVAIAGAPGTDAGPTL